MTLWCIAECNQSIRRQRRCQTDQTLICRVKHETEQRRTGERARNVREQSCRIARDGNFGSLNDLGNVRHLYVASADPFNFIGHYRALTSESRTTPTFKFEISGLTTFRQRCEPLDATGLPCISATNHVQIDGLRRHQKATARPRRFSATIVVQHRINLVDP